MSRREQVSDVDDTGAGGAAWDRRCLRGAVGATFALVYLPFCQAAVVTHDGLIYARRAELLEPGFFDGKILYILLGHVVLELTALFTEDRTAALWALSAFSTVAMAGAAQALYVALRARGTSMSSSLMLVMAFATSPLIVLLGLHPTHYALPAFGLALALALHARGRPGWAFLTACVFVAAHAYVALGAVMFCVAMFRATTRRRAYGFALAGASLLIVWFFVLHLDVQAAPAMRITHDDYFLLTAPVFDPRAHRLLIHVGSCLLSLVFACPIVLLPLAGWKRARPREPVAVTLAASYMVVGYLIPSERFAFSSLGVESMFGPAAYLALVLTKMQIFVLPALLLAAAPAFERARERLRSSGVVVGCGALLLVSVYIAAEGMFYARRPLDERTLASLRQVEHDALVYARWSYPDLDFLAQQEVRPLYGSTFLTRDEHVTRLLSELEREARGRPVYLVDELFDVDDLVPMEAPARPRHARLLSELEARLCPRRALDGLYRLHVGDDCPSE